MKTIIISIGDEITSGHTLNTNAAWMAQSLEQAGVTPQRVVTMRDDNRALVEELKDAVQKYNLILVTGGLGPTHDDVTKPALAQAFRAPLVRDQKTLRQVKAFFRQVGRPMAPVNEGQADVPKGFVVLANSIGTAPGLMLAKKRYTLVAMPGVPSEMRHIMERHVIPLAKKMAGSAVLLRTTLRTAGIGESTLAALLEERGFAPPEGVTMAYLPYFGQVDLRLTATGADRRRVKSQLEKATYGIENIAGEYIFTRESHTLEEVIGKLLTEKRLTIASAESCTGGLFASRVTSVSGASAYFLAGGVTYSNQSKQEIAGVKQDTLIRHGAVSAEVAGELAEGIRAATGADIGISSTGVAGPTGGTKEKPVGLIYIGMAHDGATETMKLNLGMDRKRNQARTANDMLVWLWRTARDWPMDPSPDEPGETL
ncbi:MAG: competence/damage-inducible protein A [Nitrospinota bacterium]|nr:competence/damage-inducible protein A [Nitrospinota bacterium]